MKTNKQSHMSVSNIKTTMDTLDRLAKESGDEKNGLEILEDTASILLDVSTSFRILKFHIKCKIKAFFHIQWYKFKQLFTN